MVIITAAVITTLLKFCLASSGSSSLPKDINSEHADSSSSRHPFVNMVMMITMFVDDDADD